MAIELITGHAGVPHVTSADQGKLNSIIFGDGAYLISGCATSMTDANTLHVSVGEIMLNGRHVRVMGNGEDVHIDSGAVGVKRTDLVCVRYEIDASGIESVSFVVKKGASGGATPSHTSGNILNGATVAEFPFVTVPLDGITVGTPARQMDSFAGFPTNRLPVIPASKGGTGQTSLQASANALMNSLTAGSSTPADDDYFIAQYANGGTETTTYHRRKVSALWSYIKGKTDALYALVGHKHSAADITSGTLAVGRGGTGRTSITSIKADLASTTAANALAGNIGVTGTLPIAHGGTGATSASAARTALGLGSGATISPSDHVVAVKTNGGKNTFNYIKFDSGACVIWGWFQDASRRYNVGEVQSLTTRALPFTVYHAAMQFTSCDWNWQPFNGVAGTSDYSYTAATCRAYPLIGNTLEVSYMTVIAGRWK